MNEFEWDKKLKIDTAGRDDYHADAYHYPYEPTPYSVLERLAESGYIQKENIVTDYGCGKGRVGFFLNHEVGCQTIGVEYDERIYAQAVQNQKKCKPFSNSFVCINAEDFEVEDTDCFYFFNPFSVEVLKKVLGKILSSYYHFPRQIKLFFYYPENEYMAHLMTAPELMFLDEIDCQDLFGGKNPRERIVIFEIG